MRYAVIVGVLLVALPLLLRINSPEPFPDADSYENIRQASLQNYDSLYSTPYHSSISDWLFETIPPQLVLITLVALTLLLASLSLQKEGFILLLATSPAILTTFTTVGEGALGVTLMALGVLLITKRSYWAVTIIPLCFSLSFSLGILSGIVLVTIALAYSLPFIALSASFFSLVFGVASAVIYPERSLGLVIPQATQLLGVVGSADGVTIFLIFLGVIGLLTAWRDTKKHAYLLSIAVIPCALFFEHGRIVLAVYLAFFGSIAWSSLVNRKWHFEELQGITLLLVACGVMFTTIVVEKQLLTVDLDRADTVRFITSAYPRGTSIYAGDDIAPILAYQGYVAQAGELPANPGFIASTLRERGVNLVVTRNSYPPVEHYPVVYHERDSGYIVYAVPSE